MRLCLSFLVLALVAGTAASCGGAKPLSDAAKRGRTIYLSKSNPGCGTCHRLNDAGSIGVLGPDLDKLLPTKEKVLTSVLQGVGAMPTQKGILTPGEMEDVAAYVAEAAGRRP